jgi:hypothetical protein
MAEMQIRRYRGHRRPEIMSLTESSTPISYFRSAEMFLLFVIIVELMAFEDGMKMAITRIWLLGGIVDRLEVSLPINRPTSNFCLWLIGLFCMSMIVKKL